MKAALLIKTGDISELSKNLVIDDIPIPEINPDEVLINVRAASLNHRDLWIAKGSYSKIKLPVVPGSDCSGVIFKKGKNVTGFNEGDEVIVNPGMNWGSDENFQSKDFKILGMPDNGTFAEYVKVQSSYLHKKPLHLDHIHSSAIPLAGVTAYRAAFVKARLTGNDNVLITGAGGGVPSFALKFAVSTGANVYVTSGSDDKIQKAIAIGAKAGVNYNDADWDKKIIALSENKINVVIDGAGGESVSQYLEICGYGGRIVCFGATFGSVPEFNVHRLYWKQLTFSGTTMGSPDDFSSMLNYINNNKIIPVVDSTYSIDDITDAFLRLNESKHFGKIVIAIS
ncbi:MAG: zinc-binding dehydrogenase [bacterium]|nr:zinc-binding dehydrogenase [bacterium]